MKIRSIQQANAANCCPCDWPECDAPRKECESITFTFGCYFDMYLWTGSTPDIPPEDLCMRFGRIHTLRVDEEHREDLDGYKYDEVVSLEEEAKNFPVDGVCVSNRDTLVSSDYDRLYTTHDVSPSVWDRVWHDYWFFDESTACDGHSTYTDSLYPGDDYDVSIGCSSTFVDYRLLIGDNSLWSYASPGVFTYHYFNDATDPISQVSWTFETTITVSFLDPFNAAYAATKLAEMSYPDDVNGSQCSAEMIGDSDCEGLITSATKSRYRFGPPDGYTRSTWDMEWDEVTANSEWWAFFDSGATGTEPSPGPSLVAHRSWVWDGLSEWSEWFEIAPPEIPGETRVVNMLTTCWKSTRTGSKPTASGPEVALPP